MSIEVNWRDVCWEDCQKLRRLMAVGRSVAVSLPKCLVEPLKIIKAGDYVMVEIIDLKPDEITLRIKIVKRA